MATKLHIQAIFASLIAIAFLLSGSNHVTEGFKVSLKMYFNTTPEGDYLHFETKHPNLGRYIDFIRNDVKLICGVGYWIAYIGDNYGEGKLYFSSTNSNETSCTPYHRTGMDISSFRYLGSSDPTKDSLSLYNTRSQRSNELLIESPAYAGITSQTISISSTGKSAWTLFEGQNFDGDSYCFPAPSPGSYYASWDLIPIFWNLTTVGSVFKGCDIAEIEKYKRNNNYS